MALNISGPISSTPLRQSQSKWRSFFSDPQSYLYTKLKPHLPSRSTLDASRTIRHPSTNSSSSQTISLLCISDTHNTTPTLPSSGADILIHAGDLTEKGTYLETQAQLDYLSSQTQFRHKVLIAGNHDRILDEAFAASHPAQQLEHKGQGLAHLNWGDLIYLQDSSVTLAIPVSPSSNTIPSPAERKLSIHGTPHTPFCGTWAYQYAPFPVTDFWHNRLPLHTEILITHGPPMGRLDMNYRGNPSGCASLLREIWRVKPRIVICGHIHESRGVEVVDFGSWREWASDALVMGQRGARGWFAVLVLILSVLAAAALRVIDGRTVRGRSSRQGRSRKTNECVIVNAAVVGGLGNVERREPIRIEL